MKKRPAVSRAQWLWFAGSLVLLVGAGALCQFRPALVDSSPTELAALRTEHATLPAPDPALLALWRKRQSDLAVEHWTEVSLAALRQSFGPRWRWTESEGTGDRQFRVSVADATIMAWPEIVAMLAKLEGRPGLSVDTVTIKTAGTRSARSFATVEIGLSIHWAGAGPGHTAAPVSPSPDRRARVRPTTGEVSETAAGDLAGPLRLAPPSSSPPGQSLRRHRSRLRALAWPARPPAARPGVRE